MPRTLIKTSAAGWFIDSANPDGPKVRKAADDTIVTQAEWEAAVESARTNDVAAKIRDAVNGDGQVKTTILDTGKVVAGPTVKIKCSDCGTEREIKVQDKFQVRRCVDCQKEHRKALRRQKLKAKREAAKAAA
jgi:hypothetical protein